MTGKEAIKWLVTFKNHTGMSELSEAFVIAVHAIHRDYKIREILSDECTDITKFVRIRELYETWNSMHGQKVVAPAGTFEKIYNECKDEEDDI